jgi:glycosyltransferase involved in cell wall biosynthesis
MADFDVFLLTSDAEGMPLVVLEALSLGIPVVSTDVGCVEELTNSVFKDDRKGVEFLVALDKLNTSKLNNSYTIFISDYVDLYK